MKQPTSKRSRQRRIISELLSTPGATRSDDGGINPVARGGKRGQGVALGLSHPALTPMPAALRRDAANPLGLRHPSLVPMPAALRLSAPVPTMGARRVAVVKSAYAVRIEANGQLVDLVDFLLKVRAQAYAGGFLTDAVADGTLWGWRARMALTQALGFGENLVDWDRSLARTQLERIALVERVLAELGAEPVLPRRGGWSVSGR